MQAENPVEKSDQISFQLLKGIFMFEHLKKKCFTSLHWKKNGKIISLLYGHKSVRHTLGKKIFIDVLLHMKKIKKKKLTQILDSVWNPRRKLGNYMSCCRCC